MLSKSKARVNIYMNDRKIESFSHLSRFDDNVVDLDNRYISWIVRCLFFWFWTNLIIILLIKYFIDG